MSLFADKIPDESSSLYKRSRKENWRLWAFKNGVQTLVDSWAPHLEKLGLDIQLGTGCKSLSLTSNNTFLCETTNGTIEADHVISSVSASRISALLPSSMDKLKSNLGDIQSVTVGVVNVEFEGKVLPFDGFGFLVPACERLNILGVVFDSVVFDQGRNKTNLTASFISSHILRVFDSHRT